MVATRWLMTMGVGAIAAGAMLALATLPALAPYRSVEPERGPAAAAPDQDLAATRPEIAYGLGSALPSQELAPDPQDGTADGEQPQWAQDRDELLALGQRAWRDWAGPGEEISGQEPDDRDYAPRRRRDRGDEAYGYAPEGDGYDRREWNDDEGNDEPLDQPEARQAYDEARPSRRDMRARRPADTADMSGDAAAQAAERARTAARDVQAAQGVQ